jgi:hypothetical protein
MKTFNRSLRLTPSVKPSRRTSSQTSSPSRLANSLERFWHLVMTNLMDNLEPKVWQVTDKYGKTYWRAYDPANGSYFSGSENDMRRWIEQRYSA